MSFAGQLGRSITRSWLNVLLLAVPLSWAADYFHAPMLVFIAAALALVPAAGLIGEATEDLALRSGPTLGGFLNATFGNAAELIIAVVALRAHHTEVVKASLTGSIIGNLLLVFGLSCFAGGLKHGSQRFNRTAAGSATVMLVLAVVALVMPAVVDLFAFGSLNAHPEVVQRLSEWTAVVLLIVYCSGLLFAFTTNRDPLRAVSRSQPRLSQAAAITLLGIATVLTTIEAELLVGALDPAMRMFGMTELFAGVIVIALVGNAAEHYSAVHAALDEEMTLALEISVGSSAQIALMVAPVLVLASSALGEPMSLVFNPFEITAVILSVAAAVLVALDGESNWLEGLQLLGVLSHPRLSGDGARCAARAHAHTPRNRIQAGIARSRLAGLLLLRRAWSGSSKRTTNCSFAKSAAPSASKPLRCKSIGRSPVRQVRKRNGTYRRRLSSWATFAVRRNSVHKAGGRAQATCECSTDLHTVERNPVKSARSITSTTANQAIFRSSRKWYFACSISF